MKRPRILLADDHPMVLEGIYKVLAQDYEIVGTVADGRALVEAALHLKPDLIVVDVAMPFLNGIDATIQIKRSLPGMKVLFFTMQSSTAYVMAALEAGGTGYVLKSSAIEELRDTVQRVLSGRIHVSPSISTEALERFQDPARAAATFRLSVRERETLQLIAQGMTAKEIAHLMNISAKTVGFHRENIKRKLGVRTIAEFTKYAIEQGMIP